MAKRKTYKDPVNILHELDKEFDDCIFFDEVIPIPRLDTGIYELTILTDGGWAKGRMTEMFAIEGVGKTTVSLQTCAGVQQRFLKAKEAGLDLKSEEDLDAPGRAAFIDIEKKYDASYAQNSFGIIHPKKLANGKIEDIGYRLYRPRDAEAAANRIDGLVRSKMFDFIVVDSAAAMCPRDELDQPVGKQHRQKQAKILTQHIRKIANYVHESGCVLLYLNQSVQVGTNSFTNKPIWEAPGARAFKHYAAMRIMLRKGPQLKAGEKKVGHTIVAKIIKNQTGKTQAEDASFKFYYGEGFCVFTATLEAAIAMEIITKPDKNKSYEYKGKKLARGMKGLREYCKAHPKNFARIKAEVEKNAEESDVYEFSESQEDDLDIEII